MNPQTKKLFQIIFQEAHVIDFDFSQWGRRIRLVVSAGLVGANFEGRGPLHNVDFTEVKELSWRANHLDVVLDSPEHHCQWVIMEFDVKKKGDFDIVKLSGFGPTPTLLVACKDVFISELDAAVIDQLNPAWNRPYLPLARPGFQDLLKILRCR